MADTEYIAQLISSLLGLGVDAAADDGGQENVLPNGETIQQQEVLKHKTQLPVADLGQGVLLQVCQFCVTQGDGTAVGGDVAGDAV